MTDPLHAGEICPTGDDGKTVENRAAIPPAGIPPENAAETPTETEPRAAKKLTAEEQMALYEKDLKDNDWGHQPC
jgi:hypothetical protein